jgi:ABC-type branched-subunit amino acid transport system ATPase component/ABC-type branched-subunit amino acid transport system permease subunit
VHQAARFIRQDGYQENMNLISFKPYRSVILMALLWLVLISVALQRVNEYQVLILGTVAISAIVGVGLNVLMGLSGQISLGHAAFYAVGAYTASILSTTYGWSYMLASLVATLTSALVGVLLSLPGLRLRGPYLAMVSIAFGYFVEQGIANWKEVTGGWNGLMGIPQPLWPDASAFTPKHIAWLATFISAILVVAYAVFSRSRWGRMMRASKDSEIASESLGIQIVWIRVLAFSVSTAITGLGGALFATLNGFISPESFPFFQSIVFLLVVLIGGRGYALGPVLGSLVVVLLPESMSFLAEYRLMFFGALLLAVLWVAPHGLSGILIQLKNRFSNPTADEPIRPPGTHTAACVNKSDGSGIQSHLQSYSQSHSHSHSHSHSNPFVSKNVDAVLSMKGLGIQFGGNYALKDIDLSIHCGVVTSLIGPNGAGKTTLINVLGGFYPPGSGQFSLNEILLSSSSTFEIARMRVARTFQTSQLFGEMSVFENVRVAVERGYFFRQVKLHSTSISSAQAASVDVYCLELLRRVGYTGNPEALALSLAHVDKRLVEIARALALDPLFIMLDEPAAGLSKEESQQLCLLLRDIAQSGVGVLLVEHDMSLVMQVSDVVHVLEAGRLIASGTPSEIQRSDLVKKAYLGEGELDFKEISKLGTHSTADQRTSAALKTQSRDDQVWLSIQNLQANYGAASVLNNISLRVSTGQCISVLGPNGSGKSTLMRSIAGLHEQKTGPINWLETDISQLPAHRIAGLRLALIPEGRQVFSELTVDDNIRLGAYSRGALTDQELRGLYDIFPLLFNLKHRTAGSLSGGEQQMVAFARGLAAKPLLLMLDEPSLGLAPAVVKDLFTKLATLRASGMTLLLVDQMAGLAMALSDYSHLLQAGDMVFSGTPGELASSGLLEQTYLEK